MYVKLGDFSNLKISTIFQSTLLRVPLWLLPLLRYITIQIWETVFVSPLKSWSEQNVFT